MGGERLQRLLFSFYREEPHLWDRLEPLQDCQFSRLWGVLRVHCVDGAHLEEVNALIDLLRAPILALGLARQIVLRAPGRPTRSYPVRVSLSPDLLA
ncbi:hypothetical protein EVJ50_13805 [Synechococcus sp. RSCCF101]|uniref:hypothetical protein n=1 Tax=Synechococcus sp. RSCCF101 TaxID=2511069 RepID=UPI001246DFAB|nr:hypothetical protein [Synechococcus sp. RSCCF101]QEY33149.1 hypothetical protein EVJ50_13805 [Synechococcus sp. RSCCF101]